MVEGVMPYKNKSQNVEYQKLYYLKYKEKYLEGQRKRRDYKRDLLIEVKSKAKCKICGENNPICLDFHHRDQSKKIATVSSIVHHYGVKKVMEEIAKCDILCANCHRKTHAEGTLWQDWK
jgi:hypothetical protein